MKTNLMSLLAFSISLNCFAEGGMVGNGGDAVVCRSSGEITSIESLDRYEARVTRKLRPHWESNPKLIGDYLREMEGRLKLHSPERAKNYTEYSKEFLADSNILHGIELVDISDSDHIAFPKNCKVEQLIVQQNPRFPEDKRFQVNGDLWDRMSNEDKAIMMFHESILRELITTRETIRGCNDQSCPIQTRELRYLNSLLFSGEVEKLSLNAFIWSIQNIPFLQFIEHPIFKTLPKVRYRINDDSGNLVRSLPVFSVSFMDTVPVINAYNDGGEMEVRLPVELGDGYFSTQENADGTIHLFARDNKTYEPALMSLHYAGAGEGEDPIRFTAYSSGQHRIKSIDFSGTIGRINGTAGTLPTRTKCQMDRSEKPINFLYDFKLSRINELSMQADQEIKFNCNRKFIFKTSNPMSVQMRADGLPSFESLDVKIENQHEALLFDGRLKNDFTVIEGQQHFNNFTVSLLPGSLLDLSQHTAVLGKDIGLFVPKKVRRNGTPVWGVCRLYKKGEKIDFKNNVKYVQKVCTP